MAHIRKCTWDESVHLTRHYERNENIKHYGNSEIDIEKSEYNYNLAPERELTQTDFIRDKLENIHHAKRKDLIVMVDLIITCPQNLTDAEARDFFKCTYDFCVDRYGRKSGLGEDCIISSYVHLDETTPHMHVAFLPIIETNGAKRFCSKEMINRKELQTLHKDMQSWLNERNVKGSVINGNTKFDSSGRALSVKELKKNDYKNTNRWTHNQNRNAIEHSKGRW